MPISYTSYTATGGQTNFPITFPYLTASDVYVDIDGVNTTAFSLVGTDVVLTSGATANEIVKVYRITPGRTDSSKILLVDFQDGSVLSEADLDKVSQQLLYLMQETYDTSAIPIDYDGNYDAGSKRLKNLSPSVLSSYDAATKSYVDGVSAYDGTVTVVPQIWNKTGADFTGTVVAGGVSGDCTLTAGFTGPVPSSAVEELFVVAYNGFTQRPNTDFSITELDSVYTFTLKMGSEVLAPADTVTIYNFGVARSYLTQPLVSETDETVGLVIKRFSEDQTANIQEWQDEDGDTLAYFTNVGSLRIGKGGVDDPNI